MAVTAPWASVSPERRISRTGKRSRRVESVTWCERGRSPRCIGSTRDVGRRGGRGLGTGVRHSADGVTDQLIRLAYYRVATWLSQTCPAASSTFRPARSSRERNLAYGTERHTFAAGRCRDRLIDLEMLVFTPGGRECTEA